MSLENLNLGDFKFINIPIPYRQEDYLQAEREFVGAYSKLPSVKSIYVWDNELLPGISDMDFILVLNDKIKGKVPRRGFGIEKFSSKLRYFYYHNPLVVNEDLLRNFDRLFLKAKLRNCYGARIEVEELEGDEKKLYKIEVLNEAIVRHLPRNILNSFSSGRADVRGALLVLNILKNSIETLKSIDGGKMGEFDGYIDGYNHLRDNWFQTQDDKKYKLLFSTAVNAVGVSLDFVELFTNYLIDNNFIYKRSSSEVSGKGQCLKFFGKGCAALFSQRWERRDSLNKTLSIYKKFKRAIPILPLPLSYQVTDYSRWDNSIGNHIRRNVVPTKEFWYFSNQEVIEKRVSLWSSYHDFLESNNIPIRYYNIFGYYGRRQIYARIDHRLKKAIASVIMNRYF